MVLSEMIHNNLIQLAAKYNLKRLILFGSRARGDCYERSDIDLAAYFNTSSMYADFCDDVENIRTLLMFDIINLNSDLIDLDLRKSINDEGVVLYEKI